jgi:mono/diheme cytochrome c family protein
MDSLYGLIAKTGFTDPLHAPLTHIPIGLVIGAFLFMLVAVIFGRKNLITTARHVSILAFLFVFPTILFGVFDWLHFYKGALIQPIKIKMILASVVLVLLGAGIIMGSEIKMRSGPMIVIYGLAFLAVIGLGWYGARLVPGVYSSIAAASAQQAQQGAQAGQQAGTKTGGPTVPPGQQLFSENCASCHPDGGNVVEAKLPVKTSEKLESLASFTTFVRSPKMPDGSEGQMPPFAADTISAQQMGDLYAYIKSMASVWK